MRHQSVLARIFLVVLIFLAAPAHAKQEVVLNRGFDAGKTYAMGGVDAIDTMSGNLVVSVPLGMEYGSNGTLSYKFGLTYNSNIWDHLYHDGTGVPAGQIRLTYDMYVVTFFPIEEGDIDPGEEGTEAFPSFQFNAGLGWTATLGELRDGFTYVAEDGSEHQFYGQLHGTVPAGPFPANGPYYTRDGSYLRMTKTKTGDDDSERLIEFPNGIQKRFACNSGCNGNPSEVVWRLTEIADPFGNLLVATYGEPSPDGTYTVTYEQRAAGTNGQVAYYARPSHTATVVRSHTLKYQQVNPWDTRLISATLAGPGSTTATYEFDYAPRTLYRERGSTWAGPGLRVPFNDTTDHDNKIDVSVLKEIRLPAGAGSWEFTYKKITPDSADADLNEVVWGQGTNARHYFTSQLDGRLTSVTLPTGGRTEYTYAPRAIPARKCREGRAENGAVGVLGVSTKTTYDRGSSAPKGVWRYYLSRYRSDAQLPLTQCNYAKELVATVVSPELADSTGAPASAVGASVQVSYFSVYWDNANFNDNQPWDPTEYGLPITKAVDDGSNRYLSSQTFQCANGNVFEAATPSERDAKLRTLLAHHRKAGETATCGAPLRSKYLRYENSGLDCDDAVVTDCRQALRRIASEKTVEHGDGTNPDTYATTDYSDYDGLGHYRMVTEGGNIYRTIFPNNGTDDASTYTRYNPLVTYDPSTKSLSHRDVPAPNGLRWLLELYDRTVTRARPSGKTTGPENVATNEFVFNVDTGSLVRQRAWGGTEEAATPNGRTAGDLVTEFLRTSENDTTARITASYYGGDDQQVLSVTQDLDALTLPSSPEYKLERQYQHGGLRLARYLKCDGTGVAFTIEDNQVDSNTGLVTSTTDNSGLTTTYGYDVIGRITSLKLPGDTETTKTGYTYTAATSTSATSATVERGSGTNRTATVTFFDGFGRPTIVESQVPDDKDGNRCPTCYNQQKTSYDALGRKEWVSVVVAKTARDEVTAGRKTFFWYDMFGRVVKSKAPDGAETTSAYFGNWHVQTKTDTLGTVDEFRDRRGRLVKVSQGSGPTFRYEYDSSDRLRKVFRFPDTERTTYTYDNRGLLTSEQQPETNRASIRYTYDARGNLLSRSYPSNAAHYDLDYEYDEAERIVNVKHGNDLTVKHYDYYVDGTGKAGKLSVATRTNHVLRQGPIKQYADYEVVQTYGYKSTNGQVETVKTSVGLKTVNGTTGMFAADQKYEYDAYGNLAAIHYPNTCTNGGCERVVTMGYRNGKIVSVAGTRSQTTTDYVSDIYYHPNGMYRKTVRGNGTQDALSLNTTTLIARPEKIEFSKNGGALSLGVFGPIAYNGAGNITGVKRSSGGDDTFAYDDLGRLTDATVSGKAQTIEFDEYDNITRITTAGTARELTTSTTNNQLSGTGFDYDDAGFMTSAPDKRSGSPAGAAFAFDWDSAGNLSRISARNLRRAFLYDVNDERIGTLDYEAAAQKESQLWTVRDAGGNLLSELTRVVDPDTGAGTLRPSRDYIFGVSGVTAAVDIADNGAESVRHFHNDHLGTPRIISDSAGHTLARDYLPFGEEVLERKDGGRLEFTGHERDDDGTLAAGSEGDFDYMHARFYAPWLGRFLSRDAVKGRNAYVYASNNPMAFIDPSGMDPYSFAAGYSYSWYAPTLEYTETITVVGTSDASVGGFLGDFANGVGYDVAHPMLEVASGIINNDPMLMAKGEGKMLSMALLQLGVGEVLAWSRTSPSAVAKFLNTPLGGAKPAPPMSPPVPRARIFNSHGMTMFGEEVQWAPSEVPNIRVPEGTSFEVFDLTAPKILSPYGTGSMTSPAVARFEAGDMMPDFRVPRLGGQRISQVMEPGLHYSLECSTPRATMMRSFVWPRGPIQQNPTGASILDLFKDDD